MSNPSWGTKRACPSCEAHFYDLNKTPATCPKCKHHFDPAAALRGKRKATKRAAAEDKAIAVTATILASKKGAAKKKDKKQLDSDDGTGQGIGDIAEMDDDDVESLQELSELEEIEETPANSDDADDESILEDIGDSEKGLVGDVEEEEKKAHASDLEEDEEPRQKIASKVAPKKSATPKKKAK